MSAHRTDLTWHFFWGLLFLSSAPLLILYFGTLWNIERYQFFPFAIAAVVFLAYQRWDRELTAPRGTLTWCTIGVGVGCVVLGCLLRSPWFAAIAFACFSATLLSTMRGPEDRSLLALAFPLLLLVRPPLGYDQVLVYRLQGVTTQMSSVLLDVLSIPHAVSGNIVKLTSRELFVAEACSGIQSVFTLGFLASILLAAYRRKLWLAPVYLAVAVFLAVAANILRVTSVAVAQAKFDTDIAEGLEHDIVGYVALFAASMLLLSFDALIRVIIRPVDDPGDESVPNPVIAAWNYFTESAPLSALDGGSPTPEGESAPQRPAIFVRKRVLSFTFATLMVGITVVSLARATTINVLGPESIGRFFEDSDFVLLDSAVELSEQPFGLIEVTAHTSERGQAGSVLGPNVDVWTCQIGDRQAQLVLSQTYEGWHELCLCYQNVNWELLDRRASAWGSEAENGETTNPHDRGIVVTRLKNSRTRERGLLMYTGINQIGEVVKPPPMIGSLAGRAEALVEAAAGDSSDAQYPTMMLQLWVVGGEPVETELERELQQDLVIARDSLIGMMASQSGD